MKVTLIGAGNVAWHLGSKLFESGCEIVQVFSRNLSKARELAELLNANFTDNLDEITTEAALYLLAIHDDAIGSVARQLLTRGFSDKLFAHTSGATPMNVFSDDEKNRWTALRFGVLYPLQTFSRKRAADFSQIPFCIDANNKEDRERLTVLARQLSPHVYLVNDEQRAVLHVAAVFVNNFSNHLFHVGHEILAKHDLPFALLLPLIWETVAKLDDGTPFDMQTGPARRNDFSTIQRHLAMLKSEPHYQELYQLITQSIQLANYSSDADHGTG
jgi:predicted short-subunit dehydrogenase-like oxidoreductase (DUF2520 family)